MVSGKTQVVAAVGKKWQRNSSGDPVLAKHLVDVRGTAGKFSRLKRPLEQSCSVAMKG